MSVMEEDAPLQTKAQVLTTAGIRLDFELS